MKINDLINEVNEKASEIKGEKYDVKRQLKALLDKIFEAADVDARADYEYGDRENVVKIRVAGTTEVFWPLRVEFKTSRELTGYNRWTGRQNAVYQLKSITIFHDMEREIGDGIKIKIDTIEDFISAEKYAIEKRQNTKVAEKEEIQNYINEHPEFRKMVSLYNKYQYQLN